MHLRRDDLKDSVFIMLYILRFHIIITNNIWGRLVVRVQPVYQLFHGVTGSGHPRS